MESRLQFSQVVHRLPPRFPGLGVRDGQRGTKCQSQRLLSSVNVNSRKFGSFSHYTGESLYLFPFSRIACGEGEDILAIVVVIGLKVASLIRIEARYRDNERTGAKSVIVIFPARYAAGAIGRVSQLCAGRVSNGATAVMKRCEDCEVCVEGEIRLRRTIRRICEGQVRSIWRRATL